MDSDSSGEPQRSEDVGALLTNIKAKVQNIKQTKDDRSTESSRPSTDERYRGSTASRSSVPSVNSELDKIWEEYRRHGAIPGDPGTPDTPDAFSTRKSSSTGLIIRLFGGRRGGSESLPETETSVEAIQRKGFWEKIVDVVEGPADLLPSPASDQSGGGIISNILNVFAPKEPAPGVRSAISSVFSKGASPRSIDLVLPVTPLNESVSFQALARSHPRVFRPKTTRAVLQRLDQQFGQTYKAVHSSHNCHFRKIQPRNLPTLKPPRR